MKVTLSAVLLFLLVPAIAFCQTDDDQLPASFLNSASALSAHGPSIGAGGVLGGKSNGSILGVDSLTNFSSYFYDPDFNTGQFTWQYTMIGRSPFTGAEGGDDDNRRRTTVIGAPIVPVIMDLRNADGTPRFVNGQRLISSPAQFIQPVLNSPIF